MRPNIADIRRLLSKDIGGMGAARGLGISIDSAFSDYAAGLRSGQHIDKADLLDLLTLLLENNHYHLGNLGTDASPSLFNALLDKAVELDIQTDTFSTVMHALHNIGSSDDTRFINKPVVIESVICTELRQYLKGQDFTRGEWARASPEFEVGRSGRRDELAFATKDYQLILEKNGEFTVEDKNQKFKRIDDPIQRYKILSDFRQKILTVVPRLEIAEVKQYINERSVAELIKQFGDVLKNESIAFRNPQYVTGPNQQGSYHLVFDTREFYNKETVLNALIRVGIKKEFTSGDVYKIKIEITSDELQKIREIIETKKLPELTTKTTALPKSTVTAQEDSEWVHVEHPTTQDQQVTAVNKTNVFAFFSRHKEEDNFEKLKEDLKKYINEKPEGDTKRVAAEELLHKLESGQNILSHTKEQLENKTNKESGGIFKATNPWTKETNLEKLFNRAQTLANSEPKSLPTPGGDRK